MTKSKMTCPSEPWQPTPGTAPPPTWWFDERERLEARVSELEEAIESIRDEYDARLHAAEAAKDSALTDLANARIRSLQEKERREASLAACQKEKEEKEEKEEWGIEAWGIEPANDQLRSQHVSAASKNAVVGWAWDSRDDAVVLLEARVKQLETENANLREIHDRHKAELAEANARPASSKENWNREVDGLRKHIADQRAELARLNAAAIDTAFGATYRRFCSDTDGHAGTATEKRNALLLGFASEVGEVLGLWNKASRKWIPPIELEEKELAELGDCLWYLTRLADLRGLTLGDLAKRNMGKLQKRQKNGSLHTEGEGR